jgi:hypothetical protein
MQWVRRNRKSGAYPAIVALALQIVLSFGHVHLSTISDVSLSATTHRVTLTQSQPPAQNPSGGDDYCAICASMFLASTSFTPAPPVLPVPVVSNGLSISFNNAGNLAEPRRSAFQSRAPPAA